LNRSISFLPDIDFVSCSENPSCRILRENEDGSGPGAGVPLLPAKVKKDRVSVNRIVDSRKRGIPGIFSRPARIYRR